MDDHFHAELRGDHDHPDPLAVNLRRVGWQHNHVGGWVGREPVLDNATDDEHSIIYITGAGPTVLHNDPGTAAVVVRTVSAWVDGNLVRPCQFGYHDGLKYNVVQLHHKDPVGLGGPEVKLDYDLDCGWDGNFRGLGACGLHHDDVHLLWRVAAKELKPGENFRMVAGWRGMFGKYTIKAVQVGWDMRVQRLDANPPEEGS